MVFLAVRISAMVGHTLFWEVEPAKAALVVDRKRVVVVVHMHRVDAVHSGE